MLRPIAAVVAALLVAACTAAAPSNGPTLAASPAVSAPATPSPVPSVDVVKGDFVVGDTKLWMECRGSGSPTVLLEWGLGGGSSGWAAVIDDLGPTVRTCRYDRAGTGSSPGHAGDAPMSAGDRAADLHALLQSAGIAGPYIPVGFSYGGMIARLFAHRYASETVGLVLVDSAHEAQFEPGSGWLEGQPSWGDGTSLVDLVRSRAELLAATDLGHLPLVVLTQGQMNGGFERGWSELQDELAALSTSSLHMVAKDSGHDIPSNATGLVEASILAVLAAAKTGSPLPACGPTFEAAGAVCLTGTLGDRLAAWDAERAAVVPAAGSVPTGTYTFTIDGALIHATVSGGSIAVAAPNSDGGIDRWSAVYAASGDRITIVWPFEFRIPETSGINTATWTVDPDGTLHFTQTDGAPKEDWLAVPWVPERASPGPS